MKKRNIKFLSKIFLLTILIFALKDCSENIFFDTARDEIIKSPNGTKSITLRYDYVSRPFIFYKGKEIFSYEAPGFNENAFFEVKWIGENEIRLYNDQYSEEYFINLE